MAKKTKIYKLDNENSKQSNKVIIQFLVGILVYALVLMIATNIFKGIYISNFAYAIVAALILSILDYYVKPIIVFFTWPLTLITLGLAYPVVNVIMLHMCDWIMGSAFEIGGFINAFIIAIFISILRIFLDNIITKNV